MTTDEAAIRALIANWHRASAAGDVDAVLDLIADDAVFLVAGRPPLAGRAAFAASLRELLRSHRIASSGEVREVAVDGDLAYTRVALVVTVVPLDGGAAATRRGEALSILRRQPDGAWRMFRDANLLGAAS